MDHAVGIRLICSSSSSIKVSSAGLRAHWPSCVQPILAAQPPVTAWGQYASQNSAFSRVLALSPDFFPFAVTPSGLPVREGGTGQQSPQSTLDPHSRRNLEMTTSFTKRIASLAAAAGLLATTSAFAGGKGFSGGNHSGGGMSHSMGSHSSSSMSMKSNMSHNNS